jgi:hypothetical protein
VDIPVPAVRSRKILIASTPDEPAPLIDDPLPEQIDLATQTPPPVVRFFATVEFDAEENVFDNGNCGLRFYLFSTDPDPWFDEGWFF